MEVQPEQTNWQLHLLGPSIGIVGGVLEDLMQWGAAEAASLPNYFFCVSFQQIFNSIVFAKATCPVQSCVSTFILGFHVGSVIQQQFDDFQIPTFRGEMQRRIAVVVLGFNSSPIL